MDDEFEEYIIRAQARDAAVKVAKEAREAARSTSMSASPASDGPKRTFDLNDSAIRIFITSQLPGVSVPPLMVTIRMSQQMKLVRLHFIAHARRKGVSVSDSDAEAIFLTWKGTKMYNTTTGRSLRLTPDAGGKFRDESGLRRHSQAGFHNGGLHFEAWTEEAYEDYLQEREKQTLRTLGELKDEGDSEPDETRAEAGKIRLILTSRELEPVRLTAHPHTTVTELVEAFRGCAGIGTDKTVVLHFDGDKLEAGLTVAGADFEDMDNVEVHIC